MTVVIGTLACPRCGATERYVNKGGSQCRGCARAQQVRYATAHPDRVRALAHKTYLNNSERTHAQSRAWKEAHPERVSALNRAWREAHPERVRDWQKLNPELRRAYNAVQRALKSGALERPSGCTKCGLVCKPEAAHADYARCLDVRWLCRRCHRRWDRADPKSAYSRTLRIA